MAMTSDLIAALAERTAIQAAHHRHMAATQALMQHVESRRKEPEFRPQIGDATMLYFVGEHVAGEMFEATVQRVAAAQRARAIRRTEAGHSPPLPELVEQEMDLFGARQSLTDQRRVLNERLVLLFGDGYAASAQWQHACTEFRRLWDALR